ncbi:Homoserine dehydrogenase [Caulifigura coniformis]|uniref:Homoserine dehydrogenase n=1 Tax=Caulifigura coniformis TaxID=2527983 RepID=A0A517SLE1_9PLAN|nr:homoserine dehydrogenase [Caulifigura coniformis]QDT56942.1 Homoserine dehydrogenase [Caulifigura coniformis]
MDSLRVGLVGFGTVGAGVAEILVNHKQRLAARSGKSIQLVRAAVRNPSKRESPLLQGVALSADGLDVARDPNVDVVLELIGGLEPARQIVRTALENGKHVVTANKALLCEHGEELFAAAKKAGRTIAFEAAVAGGVPIIHVLGQSMAANQITEIQAIINGTSNYILTEMFRNGASYGDAVRRAQEIGYAESDPSMDVQGTDAAQKLGLLTQLAYGTRVTPDRFLVQGIDTLELADLRYADMLGYAVKLVATAKLVAGRLEMHTQPTLVRKDDPLAKVEGANNVISLTGDILGETWFSGMGAGREATASAVVADVIDLAVGRAQLTFGHLDLWGNRPKFELQPAEEIVRRYYLRFNVEDKPHVMADLTDILGRNGISLSSVIQHESPEVEETSPGTTQTVPLVIMTHRTTEGRYRKAAAELDKLTCVRLPRVCLPVAG